MLTHEGGMWLIPASQPESQRAILSHKKNKKSTESTVTDGMASTEHWSPHHRVSWGLRKEIEDKETVLRDASNSPISM